MIVVKLMGGLGNQMFQFAAGRSLALQHNVPLYVDTDFLNTDPAGQYTKRKLALDQLQIDLTYADKEVLKVFRLKKRNYILNLFSRPVKTVVLHDKHRYDPAFFNSGNHVYLDGFWQTELYFKNIRNTLLGEFTPSYAFGPDAETLAAHIRSVMSVAMHVRRGDYVSNSNANSFHGVCGVDYYRSAISIIKGKVKEPVFFIFSDDIIWCRDNFSDLENCIFVDIKSRYESLDLFLMSYCRHTIIANSSYSWWAAWLNQNTEKTVIAPAKWFSDATFNPDIYCKDWIRL